MNEVPGGIHFASHLGFNNNEPCLLLKETAAEGRSDGTFFQYPSSGWSMRCERHTHSHLATRYRR